MNWPNRYSGMFPTTSFRKPCTIVQPNWEFLQVISQKQTRYYLHVHLVLAMGLGNPPAVWVETTKTGGFGSWPVQKHVPLTLGASNPDVDWSTHGIQPIWLDPSVPISSSTFQVSHLTLYSDILLLIVRGWQWYITVLLLCIGRRHDQNE